MASCIGLCLGNGIGYRFIRDRCTCHTVRSCCCRDRSRCCYRLIWHLFRCCCSRCSASAGRRTTTGRTAAVSAAVFAIICRNGNCLIRHGEGCYTCCAVCKGYAIAAAPAGESIATSAVCRNGHGLSLAVAAAPGSVCHSHRIGCIDHGQLTIYIGNCIAVRIGKGSAADCNVIFANGVGIRRCGRYGRTGKGVTVHQTCCDIRKRWHCRTLDNVQLVIRLNGQRLFANSQRYRCGRFIVGTVCRLGSGDGHGTSLVNRCCGTGNADDSRVRAFKGHSSATVSACCRKDKCSIAIGLYTNTSYIKCRLILFIGVKAKLCTGSSVIVSATVVNSLDLVDLTGKPSPCVSCLAACDCDSGRAYNIFITAACTVDKFHSTSRVFAIACTSHGCGQCCFTTSRIIGNNCIYCHSRSCLADGNGNRMSGTRNSFIVCHRIGVRRKGNVIAAVRHGRNRTAIRPHKGAVLCAAAGQRAYRQLLPIGNTACRRVGNAWRRRFSNGNFTSCGNAVVVVVRRFGSCNRHRSHTDNGDRITADGKHAIVLRHGISYRTRAAAAGGSQRKCAVQILFTDNFCDTERSLTGFCNRKIRLQSPLIITHSGDTYQSCSGIDIVRIGYRIVGVFRQRFPVQFNRNGRLAR